jgi:hypothetical protein
LLSDTSTMTVFHTVDPSGMRCGLLKPCNCERLSVSA